MKTFKQFINEAKGIMIVYHGSTNIGTSGSNVGKTLGDGIYVTSNKDDTNKGLAAIDYAGGKYSKGKSGKITTYRLTITNNVLNNNERYYLDDFLNNKKLEKWFKDRIQSWIDQNFFKNGLDGKSLLLYIENPPASLGKPASISKSGFDAFIHYNDDGTIYEAVIFNKNILKKISEEDVKI